LTLLILVFSVVGCLRREGRNSVCVWPAEPAGKADDRHLSADAEFAEDLAIRYVDAHHGLRTENYESGAAYDAARDKCMDTLFAQIARGHGVPVQAVYRSLGQNRGDIDLAIILPFVVLCIFAARAASRIVWRRYTPAENGWLPTVVMILFAALVFAAGAILVGEVWCWVLESWRLGNGHMSYRVQRLWWVQHRAVLFFGGMIIFCLAGAAAARRQQLPRAGT
jgi:hypothetical protein